MILLENFLTLMPSIKMTCDMYYFQRAEAKGYNSNGYVSGILLHVTGSMPPRPPHTPGFNKPVPASEF